MQPRQEQKKTEKQSGDDLVMSQIVDKIQESDSILIALSQNPSVDELATAIGLAMFIDKLNKHATAIYSGETPNVLAFLKPEQQFETNTNGLQDFIIAINKDKADHLRYKLDGDYVKVYITPYRTTISESDLEFSHGDYNVDLVIALNVESPDRLDGALSEHGRIMHDATIINVAAGVPGRFGEIQWANPAASSVAEMVAMLLMKMQDKTAIDKEVATAVLTGIVAATERFSNDRTQPETMAIASQLMKLGADQQLISANIIKEEEPKAFEVERGTGQVEQAAVPKEEEKIALVEPVDNTVLDVQAAKKEQEAQETQAAPVVPEPVAPVLENNAIPTEDLIVAPVEPVKPAEPVMPPVADVVEKPVENVIPAESVNPVSQFAMNNPVLPPVEMPVGAPVESSVSSASVAASAETGMPTLNADVMAELNKSVTPEPKTETESTPMVDDREAEIAALPGVSGKDYSSMIEEALSEAGTEKKEAIGSGYVGSNPALQAAPGVSEMPEENNIPSLSFDQPVDMSEEQGNHLEEESYLASSPMKTLSPEGAAQTNESVVMPDNNEEILPPPPTPPIDFENTMLPEVEGNEAGAESAGNVVSEPTAPVAQEDLGVKSDPGAFRIPGM